ncbi:AfsR/SARP family transcriptional regulator [Nonomuraea terrae]|uniref:AfsR/SARP family transcriptional regulator n=1 Tax=Nonomuraea terrae TaxID=2530383 RepID=A0A4R4YPA2_9ACTN|nr:BTAD domain-containing putative transcriptional regulator [Nonomuraea terrae]TDD46965.1 AfsR/SARP family transcriptional regulator [Nonomuraea terrae]
MIGQPADVSARFTILGPPGLHCGDTRLDLGSPQQQAVLMLLLARGGGFVGIGELIDGVWGERAPVSCEPVIRTYVSRIRRLLAEHGLASAISSRSGGYMLDPSSFALDAREFDELVETARRERADGRLMVAAKRLEQALCLWTGTALAGVPGEAAERERYRLERLKLTATQELLRLQLDMGEHAEVAAEVPPLIELNRLEEPLYEIYLLALYRGGRRAEALEVYRMVCDLLDKELGVGPGPKLRAIHERILRADADHDEFATPWTVALLLEAKDSLQRMLAAVPLTDDERAAVDDGQAALDQLLERLADVPTPSGATPRQIGIPAQATLLPVIAVNQKST